MLFFKAWHREFILSIGNYCDMEKEKQLFNFYETFLSGTPEMKPLWKRSLSNVSDQLGQLIGKMYVEKYFPLSLKNKVENMVRFIKDELKGFKDLTAEVIELILEISNKDRKKRYIN